MSIEQEVQLLEPDALVSMYSIDTNPIGGADVYNFTSASYGDSGITFGGVAFTAIDIEATGFKWDGKGGFPRPKIRVANVGGLVTGAIVTHGDLVGAKFTRLRTFAKYLDNGATPDPSAMFPPEIYTVNQRTSHTKQYVEWQLASPMEQLGIQLPRRQCIRDTCTHTYRIWNAETNQFDYSNATCPYSKAGLYTENGVATQSHAEDKCGRTIQDCKLRFGENAVLPTRAFPGITKVR